MNTGGPSRIAKCSVAFGVFPLRDEDLVVCHETESFASKITGNCVLSQQISEKINYHLIRI